MYICEDCYYGERPPMEMCNLCTMDKDGRMSCWTPKCKTPIGAVLQERQGGDGVSGAGDVDWIEEPMRDPELPVGHLENRVKELAAERDDYTAGSDCLQERVNQLQEELRKAGEENDYLRKSLEWNRREQEVLEAKVEMIYLVFGGRNHG